MTPEEFSALQNTRNSCSLMTSCKSAIVTSEGCPSINSDASHNGTGFHKWMEARARQEETTLEQIAKDGEYDLKQLEKWWDNLKDRFDPWTYFEGEDVQLYPEADCKYTIPIRADRDDFGNITRVRSAITIPGHQDLVYVRAEGNGGVIDYKCTRRPQDEPDCIDDLRMVGYGLMAIDQYKLTSCRIAKVYPDVREGDGWIQSDVLDSSNIAERRKAYEDAWKGAYEQAQKDPEYREFFPKSWGKFRCSYCPGAKRCPALRHELETLNTFLVDKEQDHATHTYRIDEDTIRVKYWPMLERARHTDLATRKLRDKLRDYVKENGPVTMDAEHELRMSDGARPSLRVMKK